MTNLLATLALLAGTTVLSPAADCRVLGAASAEDGARARSACETARARFAELFGRPVPQVRVVLWDRPGYRIGTMNREAVVFWPTSAEMTARVASTEAADRHLAMQWLEVLPHEIAHALLAARFFPEEDAPPHAGYGTPFPDWLDEAVAIWAEPLATRRRRLAQARALPGERLGLRRILSKAHPATGNAAALAARDGAAPPRDSALWSFYPQAIAVLSFVYESGGRAAVRELAERLLADPQDTEALAGLPGLPADFEDVIVAWKEWLRSEAPADSG